ncbi:DUF317 domain-containing protein [Streptomyces sp. NPDC004673]
MPDPHPDRFKDLDPAQTVRVLPRHLAGPGHVDLPTVWPFPFDQDWSLHRPGEGEEAAYYANSPCLRVWTSFLPEPDKPRKGTWTIDANRTPFGQRAWRITLDAATPAELLRDVHSELLDLYLEDRHSGQEYLFEDRTTPQEAYTPLLVSGWEHNIKKDGTQTFLAPEGLGGVRHRYATRGDDGPIWRIWGGPPSEPHWQASFSFGTPTALAAAFTASLVSAEPLHRALQNIPQRTRGHLYFIGLAEAKHPPSSSAPTPPPAPTAPGRTW